MKIIFSICDQWMMHERNVEKTLPAVPGRLETVKIDGKFYQVTGDVLYDTDNGTITVVLIPGQEPSGLD